MGIIVSFRAECQYDLDEFKKALEVHANSRNVVYAMSEKDGYGGERLAEVRSDVITEQDILNLLRKQEDSHVMIQTLRPVPLERNTFKRVYEKE